MKGSLIVLTSFDVQSNVVQSVTMHVTAFFFPSEIITVLILSSLAQQLQLMTASKRTLFWSWSVR